MMNEIKIEEERQSEEDAKMHFNSDLTYKRPPSKTCVFCDKSIDEVGGKRLVAQKSKGISLSNEYKGGGNPDYPHQSVKLSDNLDVYVVVWGEKGLWTQSAIEKAKNEFLAGHHPWFCQICGNRTCEQCGSPVNNPYGSDHLADNGSSSHASIYSDGGCTNPICEKYRP